MESMSCPEMGVNYNMMTNDLGGKLNQWMTGLQTRYGDPRVYQMQQQEMQQQDARVEHQKATKTAELLKNAYTARAEKNRETHTTRMSKRSSKRQPAASPQ